MCVWMREIIGTSFCVLMDSKLLNISSRPSWSENNPPLLTSPDLFLYFSQCVILVLFQMQQCVLSSRTSPLLFLLFESLFFQFFGWQSPNCIYQFTCPFQRVPFMTTQYKVGSSSHIEICFSAVKAGFVICIYKIIHSLTYWILSFTHKLKVPWKKNTSI